MYYGMNFQKAVNHYERRKDTTGRRIAHYIAVSGKSKSELARKCAVVGAKYGIRFTVQDLYNYTSERCQPKIDKLSVMAEAWNVSIPWLTGFEGNRKNLKPFSSKRP